MKYGNIRVDGEEFTQINKTKAAKLFASGKKIYLLPCNANPRSPWAGLYEIVDEGDYDFNNIVNHFEYYNCNGEMGKYAVFFIKG